MKTEKVQVSKAQDIEAYLREQEAKRKDAQKRLTSVDRRYKHYTSGGQHW